MVLILNRLVRSDPRCQRAEQAVRRAKEAYDSAYEISGQNAENETVKEAKAELEKQEALLVAAKKTAEADAAADGGGHGTAAIPDADGSGVGISNDGIRPLASGEGRGMHDGVG